MSEKNKKLHRLLTRLEKDYCVKKASSIEKSEILHTELYALDYVLGGGIHLDRGGHRIEFFGAESTGKSTFVLHLIKKYQKESKICAYLDTEHSYDPVWAGIIGVDNDNLLIFTPDSLEQLGDLLVELIPEVDLIVVDSIVAMIPEAEIDRDTGEPTMGLQARVNALITRKSYKALIGQKTTMIFINQLREKIGKYGNPYTTGGGRALKHFYHTRVYFKLGKPIDIKKERIGYEINLYATKNKKAAPHKKAVIDFYFNGEVDNKKSLFFSGIKYGIINLTGKTYTYGEKKAVGQDKFRNILTDNDYKKIEAELWKHMK